MENDILYDSCLGLRVFYSVFVRSSMCAFARASEIGLSGPYVHTSNGLTHLIYKYANLCTLEMSITFYNV